MGSGFSKYKKQAKMMQEQISAMQESLKNKEVEGTAGNGLVKIKLNGMKEILDVQISPECVDKEDVEGLQDLIIAAHKNALEQLGDSSGAPNLPFSL